MRLEYTNGNSKDFARLCNMLDDYLNFIVGGEKQRVQYNQYNTLENIHDVFLLYDGFTAIGCAAFKCYDDFTAEVKRVFIAEEYRGKGLSILLMSALEDKAKEKGYKSLILETGAPLTQAMQLYKALGYEVIPNYGQYKNMPDSICMKKTYSKH